MNIYFVHQSGFDRLLCNTRAIYIDVLITGDGFGFFNGAIRRALRHPGTSVWPGEGKDGWHVFRLKMRFGDIGKIRLEAVIRIDMIRNRMVGEQGQHDVHDIVGQTPSILRCKGITGGTMKTVRQHIR